MAAAIVGDNGEGERRWQKGWRGRGRAMARDNNSEGDEEDENGHRKQRSERRPRLSRLARPSDSRKSTQK